MDKLLAKIGWTAGDFQPHVRLLTLDRDDPQGSAAVEEEEVEKHEDIVDQDDRLDDDDLDDAPIRGRRTDKSAKAYDALKSERDRLHADMEKKDRQLEEMNARLARVEQGVIATRESREDANRRADEEHARIQARAKRIVDKVQAIRADDPERGQKIYTAIEEHNEEIRREERELLRQEIEQRSTMAVEQRLNDKEARAQAQRETIQELERQGLDEGCFDLVQALAIAKRNTDPTWFRRVNPDEQIPELVRTLKERLMKGKRQSQEYREDKRRHREDQDGVLGETAATKRRALRDEDEGDEDDGPGSMLADLSRWKAGLRRDTSRMLGRESRR